MKVDFYSLQNKIKNYLTDNYSGIANEQYGLTPFEKSVLSYPNLDSERKKKVLYFDFDKYYFEVLTLESYLLKGRLNLFLTMRGSAKPEIMTEEISKYTTAFFLLLDSDETLGGIVDQAVVEEIEFYEHAEGNENYKAAALRISFEKEFA